MKGLIYVILVFLSFQSFGQEITILPLEDRNGEKGDFYITWGYNRAFYNRSDIEFAGEGYSFVLNDVIANDVPEEWDPKVYLDPKQLTIPQFNFRIGYSINDRWTISGGWDHMKYKILQNQHVDIDGFIDPKLSTKYGGVYDDNDYISIDRDFIRFEHSDGFNFARLGLEYRSRIWQSKKNHLRFDVFPGVSAGVMLPWTDYTLFNTRYKNFPHLSGYGLSATLGARLEFLKYFFLQVQTQYGYANLTDINLEDDRGARGRQQVVFFERSMSLGAYVRVLRK